jgi:hypothetical protein
MIKKDPGSGRQRVVEVQTSPAQWREIHRENECAVER